MCCLALSVGSVAAQAAQRYAAPGAAGVTCKQSEPCSLEDAINGASANDEVIVTAGEYEIAGAPINVVDRGLRIHGDPRRADAPSRRRVGRAAGDQPQRRRQSTQRHRIRQSSRPRRPPSAASTAVTVERVRAFGIGEGAAGLVQMKGCLVRDSLLRGEGTNSLGMESLAILEGEPAVVVRNVTAIATGQTRSGSSPGTPGRAAATTRSS